MGLSGFSPKTIVRVPVARCNFDIAELETTVTVREQEIELRVGDSVWLGEYRVTVVEIDGDEVVFQIDDSEKSEPKETRILPR